MSRYWTHPLFSAYEAIVSFFRARTRLIVFNSGCASLRHYCVERSLLFRRIIFLLVRFCHNLSAGIDGAKPNYRDILRLPVGL